MNIFDPAQWAQFGLAGLVIAVLFFILWSLIKKFLDYIHLQHETVNQLQEAHRGERREWLETQERAIDKLTQAISESFKK